MADAFDELAGQLRDDGVGADGEAVFRWESGRVLICLDPVTIGAWEQVVGDFAQLLADRDPMVGVLNRRPFGDDAVQNAAWDLFAGEDLREARLQRCGTVLRSIRDGSIDAGAIDAWLMVCNDVRMALVGPDPDAEVLHALYDSSHPRGLVLQLASALQAELLAIC